MKELQELKDKKFDLHKKLRALDDEIEKLYFHKRLPELKEQYEGKYFKCRNSYGSPSKGWWIYYYVEEITGENTFNGVSFEMCEHGKITIEHGDNNYLNSSMGEISKEAYQKAVNQIKKELMIRLSLHEEKTKKLQINQ